MKCPYCGETLNIFLQQTAGKEEIRQCLCCGKSFAVNWETVEQLDPPEGGGNVPT